MFPGLHLCMKFFVTAKPNAKQTSVERIDATHLKVSVKEPPVDGKANDAVLREVANFFNVPFSQVQLKSGASSRHKIIVIL